ncbi:MAG: SH3 domain-containing protein [Chloroflexota bacterium]|nr:SH3 domain-containing protein [Chloroflexota bacterium]MDE2947251.1 SH3 domain-containing protein [Chloroflexota bacterium]
MKNLSATINLLIASLLLLVFPLGQALAADITVDADCSLPNAIRSANEEALVEPRADCEDGDADDGNSQVDDNGVEIPAGLDRITIDVSGTVDGVITLDGALAITSNVAIEGSGFTIEGAGNQIFNISAGALSTTDLTMNGGWTDGSGGAIAVSNAVLTLVNSVVNRSGAKELGGGIYALDSDLTLIDSVVSANATGIVNRPEQAAEDDNADASEEGAAQAAESEDADLIAQTEPSEEPEPITRDTFGAGIYFEGADNELVIDKSGLDRNVSPSDGAGLYIASGSASITNSTFSLNIAGGDGGGIYNAGESTLTHVTVVRNVAENSGGLLDSTTLLLYNSILADNEGGDCSGTLNGTIGNLIRDLSCGHDGLSDDPNLLLLGGSPAYYLPQAGSPALDAASPDYCLLTDQRGIDRTPDACDIGAAEHQEGVFQFQIQSALGLLSQPDSGGSDAPAEETPEPTPAEPTPEPTPLPPTCERLPAHITVSASIGAECKTADAAGVGNQILIDNGFIYAVDIFGSVNEIIAACFQHDDGAIVLLDAANSPRNIVLLQSRKEDGGWICADVDRAGTAVLMPWAFLLSGHVPEPVWELAGCTVTTTNILNLRSEPNTTSEILANVLNDRRLQADRKTLSFYRVNYFDIIGWLSADYLNTAGDCD